MPDFIWIQGKKMLIDMTEKPSFGSSDFVLHTEDAETGVNHILRFYIKV